MREIWVKDLKAGQEANLELMVTSLKQNTDRNGQPYVIATACDKTGSIDLKCWKTALNADGSFGGVKVGAVGKFALVIEEYKGKIGGTITLLVGPVENPDFRNFEKSSVYDPEDMWRQFSHYIKSFDSQHFREVAETLFDPGSEERFKLSPAATGMHHAFKHGLLEHTLQMLDCACSLLDLHFFSPLNKDLCMFGVMFHDFGKIYEYSPAAGFAKTAEGILVPHIPMMGARIYETCERLGVPDEVRNYMMHVVLAHHGKIEWGSPVTFACPEAAFVHYVDNLHGTVFGIIQKRESAGSEESVRYGFGSDSCTILTKPFNDVLKMYKIGGTDGF